ncbi:phosphatidate cytidylyltransferase, mitochondrial [Coccomyxa sp. Obi]|nr:phosphatidate cytidylyltransferase, mitochondrial [Coccomyxa sp. Obi]
MMQSEGLPSRNSNDTTLPDDPDFSDLIDEFPGMRHAFAYGSGVFNQPGLYEDNVKKAMIDFIFVVENPASWHYKNLRRHKAHYSLASSLHSSMMTSLSDRVGAGVYFNPSIHMPLGTIKYGVISMGDLLRDLWTWDSLVVAGRLHKPVCHIVKDPAVMKAVAANLHASVATSLLLLPRDFSTQDMYESICGLSYRGDVRVGIAEDRDKVKRIVKGSFDALQDLYRPYMQGHVATLAGLRYLGGSHWVQKTSLQSRTMLLACLPQALRIQIAQSAPCSSDSTQSLLQQRGTHEIVHNAVSSIVRKSSLRQALLGGITAGAARGFKYLLAKGGKRWMR